MKLNLRNIKVFLENVLRASVAESRQEAELPEFITYANKDAVEEIDDYQMSEIIEDNYYKYEDLSMTQKRRVCRWWNDFWGECCELIGGDLSESEMIQQISEEGFVFA